MPGIRLYTNNQLEILVEKLSDVLREPQYDDPLREEIIVVQSKGMERWISLELASRLGICANLRFPFPNAFVHEIFQSLNPNLPAENQDSFNKENLPWLVMKTLPECLDLPSFSSIKHYLENGRSGLKLFQLSGKIADTFDQYTIFRPDMVLDWEKGKNPISEHLWQAQLWRKLVHAAAPGLHRARLLSNTIQQLENEETSALGLAPRIIIFGISALPEYHIRVLDALSRHMEILLLLMNPVPGLYWGDSKSNREKLRILRKERASVDKLHLEDANSLLASLGALGRDFFDILYNHDIMEAPIPAAQSVAAHTLLTRIQSDITSFSGPSSVKTPIALDDRSIQVHSCHSPMRETEVLYDQLLDLLNNDPDLVLRDIIIMSPDIESYVPFIRAVFDNPPASHMRLPYSIADRTLSKESGVISAFLSLLNLCPSRFEAPAIAALLESEPLRKKAGLSADDAIRCLSWVREVNVRWGIDTQHKEEIGLPRTKENTWAAGIERLLLGYMLPGKNRLFFNDTLPYDHIEGNNGQILGNLLAFFDHLVAFSRSTRKSMMLHEWRGLLNQSLETFFHDDSDTANDLHCIRTAINTLGEKQALAGFCSPLDLPVVLSWLTSRLGEESHSHGFLTHGITFCKMLPMRSIPFKVICLLGMNDTAFPRTTRHPWFDFIAREPRSGDRSRKADDRYIFLEALLSARKTLYISYVGQNVQTNAMHPPSVVVSELLDYVQKGYTDAARCGIEKQTLIVHPLQAFSEKYFSGHAIFTYSEENARACKAALHPKSEIPAFIREKLPEPGDEFKQVRVRDLIAFFTNPAKFLLQKRLGIYCDQGPELFESEEPYDIQGLDGYFLKLELLHNGENGPNSFAAAKAQGILPHGKAGAAAFQDLADQVNGFKRLITRHTGISRKNPVSVSHTSGPCTLLGTINGLSNSGLVKIFPANMKAKHLLEAWISHLALAADKNNGHAGQSFLFCLDKAYRIKQPDAPCELLDELLAIYWYGLSRPLPFFPESAWAYSNGKVPSLERARAQWNGGYMIEPESRDPYFEICFRHANPLTKEFEALARNIFMPLRNTVEKI